MIQAMLWFDDSPTTTLEGKIRRAADYFRKKYGRDPNLCVLNHKMPGALEIETVDEIAIDTSRIVLPNHLWIGVDE